MSEWDDVAAGWDDEPAVRRYAGAAHRSLVALATDLGVELSGRALDFGCGTGLLTERLVETYDDVVAVDVSERMLDVLRSKATERGWANVHPSTDLPADQGPYDLIVASSVLGFVDDHPATVRSLGQRLSPGGLLVHWDWEADPTSDDPHGLLRPAVEAALRDAGLTDVGVGTGFTLEFDGHSMAPLMGWGRRGI
ncbi:MAG: class I SAM-dependent methyltransferase [Actinomycetota bacterium]